MKKIANQILLIICLFGAWACGGSNSGIGTSSLSSNLSSPYKYYVYVANYGDNTISSFSMNGENGTLTPIETTASEGNPISLAVNPNGDKLYVAKGNSSSLQVFNINKANGALTPFQSIATNNSTQSSVAVSSDGRFVYVSSYSGIGNIYSVSTLTGNLIAFKNLDSTAFKELIHPNGNSLYLMSNAGITFWPINKNTGEALIFGGAYTASMVQPHSMVLSTDGTKMYASYNNQSYGLINSYNLDLLNNAATANQTTWSGSSIGGIAISNFGKVLIATEPNNNKIRSFLINQNTGALTEADSKVTESYPHHVTFFPDGKYFLTINKIGKSISIFSLDEVDGGLRFLLSTQVGNDPYDLLILKIPK